MSLYTNEGDKISMGPLYEAMEYAQDAQQIENGEFFNYINDLFGVYGGIAK